jgi:hypothetical protein
VQKLDQVGEYGISQTDLNPVGFSLSPPAALTWIYSPIYGTVVCKIGEQPYKLAALIPVIMPQAPSIGNGSSASLSYKGLSEGEAVRRLQSEGYNELARARKRDLFRITVEVCSEPMFELLLATSTIYFVLGDFTEALILVGSAITSSPGTNGSP